MSDAQPGIARRALRLAAFGALAIALLAWPARWILASQAERLQAIEPGDAAKVQTNRDLYALDPTGEPGEIVKIYGAPLGEPTAYVFVDEERVFSPPEQPDLRLLRVRKSDGENPLQLKTVERISLYTSLGAAAAAAVLFGLLAWLRRRTGRQAGSGT